MIFGSIGTLIDKIKELVVEYLNGIAGQFNETIDLIRKDIETVSSKLDDVKSVVEKNNLNGEISKLNEGIGKIEWGINDGVQGELGSVKETVENRFNVVDENLRFLAANVSQLVGERATELESLRSQAAQVEVLRQALTEKENAIHELEVKFNSLKEKSDSMASELEQMDGKLTGAQDKLKVEVENSAATKESLQMWRDAVADYVPVRDAMRNCDTFKKLLEERGLNDETDKGLFAFVQELGKTIDFLRDVYNTALVAKKMQPNPAVMTSEERAVYEALNKCYRRIWNIDFDVFATPGERKSIGSDFYKIPFNKDDAVVLKDVRNKSLKFVKEIYVPLLLSREGRMYKQAYVEAVNF